MHSILVLSARPLVTTAVTFTSPTTVLLITSCRVRRRSHSPCRLGNFLARVAHCPLLPPRTAPVPCPLTSAPSHGSASSPCSRSRGPFAPAPASFRSRSRVLLLPAPVSFRSRDCVSSRPCWCLIADAHISSFVSQPLLRGLIPLPYSLAPTLT